MAITDLNLWSYHQQELATGRPIAEIASALEARLKSGETWLRVGLARGWKQYPGMCFLQITGVYTFPDDR